MANDEATDGNAGTDAGRAVEAEEVIAYAKTAVVLEDDMIMRDTITLVRNLALAGMGIATVFGPTANGDDDRRTADARATLEGLRATPVGQALLDAASVDEADLATAIETVTRAVGIMLEEDAMRELGLEYVDAAVAPTPKPAPTDATAAPHADEPATAAERCEWPPRHHDHDGREGLVAGRIVAMARAGMRGAGWHLLREAANATHALEAMRTGRKAPGKRGDPPLTPAAAARELDAMRGDEAGWILLEALRNSPERAEMAGYAMARAAMSGLGAAKATSEGAAPTSSRRRGRRPTLPGWAPWALTSALAGALAVALARPGQRD